MSILDVKKLAEADGRSKRNETLVQDCYDKTEQYAESVNLAIETYKEVRELLQGFRETLLTETNNRKLNIGKLEDKFNVLQQRFENFGREFDKLTINNDRFEELQEQVREIATRVSANIPQQIHNELLEQLSIINNNTKSIEQLSARIEQIANLVTSH